MSQVERNKDMADVVLTEGVLPSKAILIKDANELGRRATSLEPTRYIGKSPIVASIPLTQEESNGPVSESNLTPTQELSRQIEEQRKSPEERIQGKVDEIVNRYPEDMRQDVRDKIAREKARIIGELDVQGKDVPVGQVEEAKLAYNIAITKYNNDFGGGDSYEALRLRQRGLGLKPRGTEVYTPAYKSPAEMDNDAYLKLLPHYEKQVSKMGKVNTNMSPDPQIREFVAIRRRMQERFEKGLTKEATPPTVADEVIKMGDQSAEDRMIEEALRKAYLLTATKLEQPTAKTPEQIAQEQEALRIVKERLERMEKLEKTLEELGTRVPENERIDFGEEVYRKSEEVLNKMFDDGKTNEAIELMGDSEGMLNLRIQKANELLEQRKLQSQPVPDINAMKPSEVQEEISRLRSQFPTEWEAWGDPKARLQHSKWPWRVTSRTNEEFRKLLGTEVGGKVIDDVHLIPALEGERIKLRVLREVTEEAKKSLEGFGTRDTLYIKALDEAVDRAGAEFKKGLLEKIRGLFRRRESRHKPLDIARQQLAQDVQALNNQEEEKDTQIIAITAERDTYKAKFEALEQKMQVLTDRFAQLEQRGINGAGAVPAGSQRT